jgi:hypothetical protein
LGLDSLLLFRCDDRSYFIIITVLSSYISLHFSPLPGFTLWKAKALARYAAARARLEETAAQVMLDMAAKYSCGLGEHWARRVLAGRRGRRRSEKREAAKLAKGRKPSESPSCFPADSRAARGARKLSASVVRKLVSLRHGASGRQVPGSEHVDGAAAAAAAAAAEEESDDPSDSSDSSLFSDASSSSSSWEVQGPPEAHLNGEGDSCEVRR